MDSRSVWLRLSHRHWQASDYDRKVWVNRMVSVNVVQDCHHMSLGFLGQLRTGGQLGTTLVVPSDGRGNSWTFL